MHGAGYLEMPGTGEAGWIRSTQRRWG
jgi:hypothetical protein